MLHISRGERFAFGHHYFRPHETHHSPSRRFYKNELFRMPLYEIIPLEAVVGTCCVLDLYTYCKGESRRATVYPALREFNVRDISPSIAVFWFLIASFKPSELYFK